MARQSYEHSQFFDFDHPVILVRVNTLENITGDFSQKKKHSTAVNSGTDIERLRFIYPNLISG